MISITRRGALGAAAIVIARQASAQPIREVTIGVASTSLVACSPRIANEMGPFQRRGLQPRFVIMDSANTATAALISGSVRLAVSGPGELVVAQSRARAHPVELQFTHRLEDLVTFHHATFRMLS